MWQKIEHYSACKLLFCFSCCRQLQLWQLHPIQEQYHRRVYRERCGTFQIWPLFVFLAPETGIWSHESSAATSGLTVQASAKSPAPMQVKYMLHMLTNYMT